MGSSDLITELDRLHHRASDMRARERQLADAGENDPASDAWKTAAILAASAESEFKIALVEAWPTLAALLREAAEDWRPIESAPDDGRQVWTQGHPDYAAGLTKREYFAAQALAGLLAQSPCSASAEQFAQEAVRAADALIKALEAPDAED